MDNLDDSQAALVPHTYQGAVIQQTTSDGYINATAMCKAAGKEWSNYRQNATSNEFIAELERSLGIPRDRLIRSVVTGPNEQRGTWVHPQVAINLAQWVSPAFAVLVSEWVFEWLTGKKKSDKVWEQFQDRVSLVYDSVPSGYFCIFREIADVFASLFSQGVNPGTKMLLDISVGWHWGQQWTSAMEEKFGHRRKFEHHYPKYFSQSASNPQPAWCYPEDALPSFRRWMRETYIPRKMPAYLQTQVAQGRISQQAANNTRYVLQQREKRRSLLR